MCTAVPLFIPQLLKGSSPSKPACLGILSRGGVRRCLRVLKERLGCLPAGAGLRGYADRSQAEWHFQSGKQLCERIWVSTAPPPWEQIRSAKTVSASPRRCLQLRETAPAGSGCCCYIYKTLSADIEALQLKGTVRSRTRKTEPHSQDVESNLLLHTKILCCTLFWGHI